MDASSIQTLAYDRLHLTRCRDQMDIHSTRAMRGANCWTDHQMLWSKVAFRIRHKHNRQGTSKPTKPNTPKLSTISHRESFEQWSPPMGGEGKLNTRRGICSSAAGRLGKPDRKHQGWFDPNDQELQILMSRRDQTHQRVLQSRNIRSTTAAFKDACKLPLPEATQRPWRHRSRSSGQHPTARYQDKPR